MCSHVICYLNVKIGIVCSYISITKFWMHGETLFRPSHDFAPLKYKGPFSCIFCAFPVHFLMYIIIFIIMGADQHGHNQSFLKPSADSRYFIQLN